MFQCGNPVQQESLFPVGSRQLLLYLVQLFEQLKASGRFRRRGACRCHGVPGDACLNDDALLQLTQR